MIVISTLLLPISCFSSHFFQSNFLFLHLLPPDCAAYKSDGDRLAPLGMSQPGARSKGSSPDTPRLCSETTSQGDIYMKGTYPSHPSLKAGKKESQVIFGLRPLVGLSPAIVSIYITALCLCIKVKCVFAYWKVQPRPAWRACSSSHHRGAAPLLFTPSSVDLR